MSDTLNRQLVLIARPDANVGPEHFEMRRSTVPALEAGQALVRVHEEPDGRWVIIPEGDSHGTA